MSLVSREDEARIAKAVAEVERHTAGEIATVVAERSHDYAYFRALVTALSVVTLATVLSWIWPVLAGRFPALDLGADLAGWLIPAQLLLAAPIWMLTGRPALLRRFVPAPIQGAAVDARAKAVFLDHGVTETRDRSGVLVFLSELEHRVVILADRGIHLRVGVEGWRHHVDDLVQAIRRGRAGDGIVACVEAVGRELREAFPPREDDENELSDAVQRVE
jgi:putative membrane protein